MDTAIPSSFFIPHSSFFISLTWLELSVAASHEASEAVYAVLSRYAPGAVAIEEPIRQSDDGDDYAIDYDQPVIVRAYVPVDGEEAAKRSGIEQGIWHLRQIDITGIGDLSSRELAEEDWANAWKEHYQTRRIGQRLVIKPSWLEYQATAQDVVVELDPGMAFGTGLHPTTESCLRLLEELVKGGEEVLDLGTGSGILALAAVGLGARSVLALDVDSVAVETATQNVANAGRQGEIQVRRGSLPLSPTQQFDLVLANIVARVLAGLAKELREVMSPRAALVASGIIADREGEVLEAFEAAGLCVSRRTQDGDWITLLIRPAAT